MSRDFYMRRKMNEDGYLPVTLLASFHRIQALTMDLSVILSAIKNSDKLEIAENYLVRTKLDPTSKYYLLSDTSLILILKIYHFQYLLT